jgi:hypothetical protein
MHMEAAVTIPMRNVATRRRLVRATTADVRAWTGRSAMSSATDSVRPRIATAGTGRTRVSVARISGSRMGRCEPSSTLTHPAITLWKPGSLHRPPQVSG